MKSFLTTVFKALFGNIQRVYLVGMGLFIATLLTVIVIRNSQIDKLKEDNKILQTEYQAAKQELVKKISDHRFDVLPQPVKDFSEELKKAEIEWLKRNEIKLKDLQAFAKISTKVDTTLAPSKIESAPKVEDPLVRDYKLDFSNESMTNIVTFSTVKDSVFNPRSRVALTDSIHYVSYKEKIKVGTKRFLFIKFPKYETYTKITVSNSNEIVKMDDVIIKVKQE